MALIVVQAGHYPRKTGATGTGGLDADPTEQEFTIAAANACAGRIRAAGHQCRVIWADVPPGDYAGDAFVAIHCDGSTSSSARGASVGYRTTGGQTFAAAFKRAYQAEGWSGGWRPDNYTAALAGYYGTKRAVAAGNRRAFIAEAGFLTNPADEALLSPPHGPERFARALTAAVVELFGGHEEDLMSKLTDGEQLELLRKVREIHADTADRDDGRLHEVTLASRTLLDARAPGYFAKAPEAGAVIEPVVYYVDAAHQSKVQMPVGGPLHEHIKALHRIAELDERAVVVDVDVLDAIPTLG